MAYFLIKHIGQEGNILSKPVEATTKKDAISKSGIHERNIDSVEVDHLGSIRAAFTEKRLPLSEQVLALVTIASKLETGRTPGKAVSESVDLAALGLTEEDFAACEKPSDYFKLMKFDETAILLAEAGDNASNLSESLKRASAVMRDRLKTKKEFAKPMKTAAINFVVGVGSGIGFPIFGGYMINDFIYKQKMPIKPTTISNILIWLHDFYLSMWPVLIVALLSAYIFRSRVWDFIREWPLCNLFNNRTRCRRGLEFVQTYQLLTNSGFTNPQVLKFMAEKSSGRQRALYEEALEQNKVVRELGDVFVSKEWPKIIPQNMKGFEEQPLDGQAQILKNLSEALTQMFIHYSERIAETMSIGSMIVLVGSILLFALGFYVPLMTMRMTM